MTGLTRGGSLYRVENQGLINGAPENKDGRIIVRNKHTIKFI